MLKQIGTMAVVVAIAAGMISVAGCSSDAGNTALLGTAIGAGVGALAGGGTEGVLIGAAIGGGAGYAVGNESDKRKTRQEIASVRAEQNIVTVWVANSNGSQNPVKLRKDGPGYIGPRQERYSNMPTLLSFEQLYHFTSVNQRKKLKRSSIARNVHDAKCVTLFEVVEKECELVLLALDPSASA